MHSAEIDSKLAQHVINKLRDMSCGTYGINAEQLADAILNEKLKGAKPVKAIRTLMIAEVYKIIKSYFPYANRETKITLGEGKHPSAERTHITLLNKDALIISLLTLLKDNSVEIPDDVLEQVKLFARE